jgi:DNA-binding winged helix-turn-helix (wHTH) protein/tetratricopeptide (TPR) repeat protein
VTAAKSYTFGTYTVDLARREIHRGDDRLDVPAKVFDCVTYLIEHRDRAVGRDELISAVWGRADISDNLLAQIVLRARRSFDDDADAQKYIRTITGFGYRWVNDDAPAQRTPATTPAVAVAAPVGAMATTIAARTIGTGATPSDGDIARTTPAPLALPSQRLPFSTWQIALAVLVAIAGWRIAQYLIAHRTMAPTTAASAPAAEANLAFVLPANVRDAPEFAWARLGVMDLVAQRLREAGQTTVPSETVVALAKFAGDVPTAAELSDIAGVTGATTFYAPDVRHESDAWRVRLATMRNGAAGETYEASAKDLIEATGAATARLMTALNLSPIQYYEGSGPAATLAQQVASALLQDRVADARSLIENAPADLRDDPHVRLQQAAVDYYQSRLPEARKLLDALAASKPSDQSPEFTARILVQKAALEGRSGNYAASERIAGDAIRTVKDLDRAVAGNALGSALMVRATARLAQGQYDAATDDFAAARMVLTTTGNLRVLAMVDANFGMMQMQRDRYREALSMLTKSAEFFQRIGSPYREVLNRTKIAGSAIAMQDFEAAAAEDARLAELIPRIEDPESRGAARGARAEIAFALGRTRDAQDGVESLLGEKDLSDAVRGPALAIDGALALQRADNARAIASAKASLALKWADERARDFASTWLLLVRAERPSMPEQAAKDAAHARAWASSSIYPATGLIVDLIEAEQLAATGQGAQARTTFERALKAAGDRETPADIVEVSTSYAAWLIEHNDLERALAVLGRNQSWAASNYRVAVSEARLYRALGNEKLWRSALERAQATAGERVVPDELSHFGSEPEATGDARVAARGP